MGLTETQTGIAEAISALSVGDEPPFTTIAEIADHLPYSKQAVRNNIDAVVEERDDIGTDTVGQANVYYLRRNRIDDLMTDETAAVAHLRGTDGRAEYVALRETEDADPFDLEAHWFDVDTNPLSGYWPDAEEIGRAAEQYADAPLKVKYLDRESIVFPEEEENE